jgi:O-antigen/teichoic acid export membrane protein
MSELKKKFKNSIWILFEKASKIISYFVVGIMLARYLGPKDLGIYNLIITVITIASAFSALGLNGILIKEYVQQTKYSVLSAALITRGIGVLITSCVSAFILGYYFYAYIGGFLLIFLSLAVTFSLVQVVDLYFESQLKNSINAKYRVTAYVLGGTLKIYLLMNLYDYKYILFAHVVELMSLLVFGFWFLTLDINLIKLKLKLSKINGVYIKSLLIKGAPLIISSVAVILYMKVDQFFIFYYMDEESVGLYSAATRLCEGFFLLSAIILPSFFPSLIKNKNYDIDQYYISLKQLVKYLVIIGSGLTFVIYFISEDIINVLYGSDYSSSYRVLAIYSLSIPIIYIGDVLSKWLIIEDLTNYSMLRHFMGLVVNIIFNIILIPIYGIEGAAIASVLAYFSAVVLFILFTPKIRTFFFIMIK